MGPKARCVLLATAIACEGALLRPHVARAFVPPNVRASRPHGEMIYVPATQFAFAREAVWKSGSSSSGSDPAGYPAQLGAFYIDRLEVSAAQYKACVVAGPCAALTMGDTFTATQTPVCTYEKLGFEQHPINCVSHDEAETYCRWVGKRLPLEPEFELAERGPGGRPFPWGDADPGPKLVNACDDRCAREGASMGSFSSMYESTGGGDDGWAFTAPVGSYPDGASPYGVLDLAGNVEEWVADPYFEIAGPYVLPTASPGGEYVIRGGSWDLNTGDALSGVRRTDGSADTRAAWLGFRCARDG